MTEGPLGRAATVALLRRHGVTPRKRYGQHFLVDPNIVRKIVGLIQSPPGTPVLEIGAGTGALTVALAAAGFPVVAYEIDRRLEPALREVVGDVAGVEVRFEDAAGAPFGLEGRWVLAANLPYNVGTGMLLDVLRTTGAIEEMVVMVQAEVADRLAAARGSKVYGLPSVIAQLFAHVERAFTVPPQVFFPPPRVGSAVVRLERTHPPSPLLERAVALAGAAFAHRRKMLRSSLAGAPGDPLVLLAAAGVDASLRAEDLTPGDYLRLAEAAGA